jgi:phage gp46-like protein
MTDVSLGINPEIEAFDILLDGPDLATEEGLKAAIYISLGTDARARPEDEIPDGTDDRRGFWGDAFNAIAGDVTGSRLWLLERSKTTAEVLRLAKDYGLEALQWLIEDKVASSVDLSTERQDATLAFAVIVTRPDGRISKFDYVWEGLFNGL